MNYNTTENPYPSSRNTMHATKGVVATSTPQAAQAGLEILKKGGNAIDAAIATAATLTVVEPSGNGIGGDSFALVWVKGKLYGLNSSGYCPANLNGEIIKNKGHKEMPKYGWEAITVPGIPAGWAELSRKFGKLPLSEVLEPAARYAEEGYAVSVNVSKLWHKAFDLYKREFSDDYMKNWFKLFAPDNRALNSGDIFRSKEMANTLRSIGQTNGRSFYEGELADKILKFSNSTGGYFTAKDLADYKPEWVEPISVNYKGYDVHEIPPNGHGICALMALNIIKGLDLDPSNRELASNYHKQLEAIKLAFVDAKKYVADPKSMNVSAKDLLSDAYADERRKLIGKMALDPVPGKPRTSGTVYLAATDSEGNMVSYIQSNYMGFGSGVVVPGTGISLHNRGNNFSLDESSANYIAPLKRPYHTIIPAFMTKGDKAVGPFGVMGGFMQPQGHVQVVTNTVDFNLNPQAALDAPRWQWVGGKKVMVEAGIAPHIVKDLASRGHDVEYLYDYIAMGRGQIIWQQDNGAYAAGTEMRTDGTLAIW